MTVAVHRPDGGRGGAGEIIAHDHLDRQHAQASRHRDVRVGKGQRVVAADVHGRLEPEARRRGQHLPLERHRRQHVVERALPVGGDNQPSAIRQVIVVANLAARRRRQAGKVGCNQNIVERRANPSAQSSRAVPFAVRRTPQP